MVQPYGTVNRHAALWRFNQASRCFNLAIDVPEMKKASGLAGLQTDDKPKPNGIRKDLTE
jgi:hypothetical protein